MFEKTLTQEDILKRLKANSKEDGTNGNTITPKNVTEKFKVKKNNKKKKSKKKEEKKYPGVFIGNGFNEWDGFQNDIDAESSYSYTSYTHFKCHKGNVKVWEKDNLIFYGGGTIRDLKTDWEAVYINMLERETPPTKGYGILSNITLCPYPNALGYLNIPTPDRGHPEIGASQWKKIYDTLKEIAKTSNSPIKVVCHCLGGHGRTGIALTIFGMISGALPNNVKDAIPELRKKYCERAIESLSQVKYIQKIVMELGIQKNGVSTTTLFNLVP